MLLIIKKMSVNIFNCFALVICVIGSLLVLCGCESLPDGDPPEGPIVTTKTATSCMVSINQAVNYMTTSLSMVAIQYGLRDVAVLKTFSDGYSNRVFRQVADTSGMVAATGTIKPKLLLTSKFIRCSGNMTWEMQLIRLSNNKVIWTGKAVIKTPKP